ncbi:hypothetical protein FE634_16820 [Nocardioides dongxiaopingii]|uniref:hypothetical protein n=1 Tax=Nocardioides sp. S-1144 TaxID=2582905 RepID=UPI00110E4DE5|nr:hypothetical protein [Nocardioides sp. S-1144]QCW51661.1 hypothetical protein FE634_16820 [Nocardioides sp. S-1144]
MRSRPLVPLLALVLGGSALAVPAGDAAGSGGAAPPARVVTVLQDPAITESSGLVARRNTFVTVNDSGDGGQVFTVDRDGATVGVTSWRRRPVDVEALAPAGRGRVWVGDVGGNVAARTGLTVVRVPFGPGDRRVRPRRFVLRLPGGPVDVETMMVRPRSGRLVLVTKEAGGGRFLLAPRTLRRDRPNRLVDAGAAPAVATDGAFFPDGRHVVVRGYEDAAVYTWPGRRLLGRFDLPAQQQGEGIAVGRDGRVYLSSEGVRAPLLRVRLPRWLARAVRS